MCKKLSRYMIVLFILTAVIISMAAPSFAKNTGTNTSTNKTTAQGNNNTSMGTNISVSDLRQKADAIREMAAKDRSDILQYQQLIKSMNTTLSESDVVSDEENNVFMTILESTNSKMQSYSTSIDKMDHDRRLIWVELDSTDNYESMSQNETTNLLLGIGSIAAAYSDMEDSLNMISEIQENVQNIEGILAKNKKEQY